MNRPPSPARLIVLGATIGRHTWTDDPPYERTPQTLAWPARLISAPMSRGLKVHSFERSNAKSETFPSKRSDLLSTNWHMLVIKHSPNPQLVLDLTFRALDGTNAWTFALIGSP